MVMSRGERAPFGGRLTDVSRMQRTGGGSWGEVQRRLRRHDWHRDSRAFPQSGSRLPDTLIASR
jgi:hypothetical protein